MTASNTLLAGVESALQQAAVAFDSASATMDAALAASNADRDALSAKVDAQAATIADLKARIAQLDPWAQIDNTGAIEVTDLVQARVDAGDDIPAGRYLVDPTKPIKVTRDGFTMDPQAVFVAQPSPSPRDCIMDVVGDNLSVTLGQIIGDRMSGAYTPGSTNEWGYGVKVTGDNVKVYDANVSQCTGDGFGIVGKNCELHNCMSAGNRRQAVSVFNADGFMAFDCKLLNTGALTVDGKTDAAAPNGPCAGIDFEPDAAKPGQPAPLVNAHLERCTIAGNRAGVLGWLRSEVGGSLNITIVDCDIGNNANGINTKALAGKVTATVLRSRLTKNTGAAVRAEPGSTVNVGSSDPADANTIVGMAKRTLATRSGIVTQYDLQKVGVPAGVIVAGVNNYA